jgi:hypothetical protein
MSHLRSPRPSTALQRDLMAVFMGFPVRKPRKPKLVEPHHEPALKLGPKSEPEDKPKEERTADHDVDVEPDDLLVTNTHSGARPVLEPVVNPIAAATTVESALRSRRSGDVTNAARQSRWRSKQDAAALRLQARERMKVLRARRRAAP